MNGPLFRVLALVVTAASLTGCHISRPADPNRRATAALPGPDAWPSRELDAVRGLHERTPEVIRRYELSGLIPEDELDEKSRERLERIGRVITANHLTKHGLFRAWEVPSRDVESDQTKRMLNRRFRLRLFPGMTDGFSPNAYFLSSRNATGFWLEDATEGIPDVIGLPRGEGLSPFVRGLQETYTAESILLDEGVAVSIPGPGSSSGKGVLIALGGYLPSTWEDSSIALFRNAGWRVVLINTPTHARAPNEDEYRRASSKQNMWIIDKMIEREQRLGHLVTMKQFGSDVAVVPSLTSEDLRELDAEGERLYPLPLRGFEVTDRTDPGSLGASIAQAIDDTVAESAYAAAAAIEYLRARDGAGSVGPLAVIGYSAGSFAAPAVASRLLIEGHDVSALMLIGGGADLLNISQKNPITNGGINLTGRDGQEPDDKKLEQIQRSYLEHTHLDPYALAPALADIPTLLMIASDDRMVPNGELLDERLGYPDRIRYFGGHGGLFYFLPQQTPRMVRWLERVTGARRPIDAQNREMSRSQN